jgi:hypothetical protein
VEELVLSCGNVNPNQRKLKCDRCQCGESICTRELREQLRKLRGREISVFVKNELALIIGTLIKVNCGTILVQGSIQESVTIRPILIKICDITGFICGNFFLPNQTECFSFLNHADENYNCHACTCKTVENDCVRDLRVQLKDCIGKNIVINIIGQTLAGPLLKVSCGSVLIRDFTGFIFYVPICQIQYVHASLESSSCDFSPRKVKQEVKCKKSECVNDVCTATLRKELEECINKQVQIAFECFNPPDIPNVGVIQKVSCGSLFILMQFEISPNVFVPVLVLIPLCQISSVVNVSQS